jgi:hypothetical protein
MLLANLPLLQHATAGSVQQLLDHAHLYALPRRARLLQEGAPVRDVFFLLRGVARLSHAGPSGSFSPKVLVGPCHFGHLELLTGTPEAFQSVETVQEA